MESLALLFAENFLTMIHWERLEKKRCDLYLNNYKNEIASLNKRITAINGNIISDLSQLNCIARIFYRFKNNYYENKRLNLQESVASLSKKATVVQHRLNSSIEKIEKILNWSGFLRDNLDSEIKRLELQKDALGKKIQQLKEGKPREHQRTSIDPSSQSESIKALMKEQGSVSREIDQVAIKLDQIKSHVDYFAHKTNRDPRDSQP